MLPMAIVTWLAIVERSRTSSLLNRKSGIVTADGDRADRALGVDQRYTQSCERSGDGVDLSLAGAPRSD